MSQFEKFYTLNPQFYESLWLSDKSPSSFLEQVKANQKLNEIDFKRKLKKAVSGWHTHLLFDSSFLENKNLETYIRWTQENWLRPVILLPISSFPKHQKKLEELVVQFSYGVQDFMGSENLSGNENLGGNEEKDRLGNITRRRGIKVRDDGQDKKKGESKDVGRSEALCKSKSLSESGVVAKTGDIDRGGNIPKVAGAFKKGRLNQNIVANQIRNVDRIKNVGLEFHFVSENKEFSIEELKIFKDNASLIYVITKKNRRSFPKKEFTKDEFIDELDLDSYPQSKDSLIVNDKGIRNSAVIESGETVKDDRNYNTRPIIKYRHSLKSGNLESKRLGDSCFRRRDGTYRGDNTYRDDGVYRKGDAYRDGEDYANGSIYREEEEREKNGLDFQSFFKKRYLYFPYKSSFWDFFLTPHQVYHFLQRRFKLPPYPVETYDKRIPKDIDLEPVYDPFFESGYVASKGQGNSYREFNISLYFSVVIPCYNSEKQLLNTLKFLVEQDFPKNQYEVIVIDDGSPRSIREGLMGFSKQNPDLILKGFYLPRVIEKTKNSARFRAGLARNLGAKHSKGKYLAFLDSDILVPPDYLSKLKKEHKKADLILVKRYHLNKKSFSKKENLNSEDLFPTKREKLKQTDSLFPEDKIKVKNRERISLQKNRAVSKNDREEMIHLDLDTIPSKDKETKNLLEDQSLSDSRDKTEDSRNEIKKFQDLVSFKDKGVKGPSRDQSLLDSRDKVQDSGDKTKKLHGLDTVSLQAENIKAYIEEESYWGSFYKKGFDKVECPWKYICTYGLSLLRKDFNEVGGFGKAFLFYGFEDTDLGYRLLKKKKRAVLSDIIVFHQAGTESHSMNWSYSLFRQKQLFKTAKIFFYKHLDLEIYKSLKVYMRQERTPSYFL